MTNNIIKKSVNLSPQEIIDEIDFILSHLEDYTHGEDGKEITRARGLLIELKSKVQL